MENIINMFWDTGTLQGLIVGATIASTLIALLVKGDEFKSITLIEE